MTSSHFPEPTMHHTLRRSCASCARAKCKCNLGTPRCSRCLERNKQCVYANEPSSAPAVIPRGSTRYSKPVQRISPERQVGAFDPFNAYPPTRLSQQHVQRLVHRFRHKIAFEYYPLDLDATSNPFLASWWPRALVDPALFHVSLQTACLDEELFAQKGFQSSEILMADSVMLLRQKIANSSSAVQNETMSAVITLAAIEHGKGNIATSTAHVEGVKALVDMKGGISAVRRDSPLTARMVSWVSMIIIGAPQFDTQDDFGTGGGISAIPEWQSASHIVGGGGDDDDDTFELDGLELDAAIMETLARLHVLAQQTQQKPLSTTKLHDLACFVIHRLLQSTPDESQYSTTTQCMRYAIILYMFTIHGPTYYSHTAILHTILTKFTHHLKQLEDETKSANSFYIWLVAIGLTASLGMEQQEFFSQKARSLASSMQSNTWEDVKPHMKRILWLNEPRHDDIFRLAWLPQCKGCDKMLQLTTMRSGFDTFAAQRA